MSNPWEDFNSPVAEQDSAAPWEEFGSDAAPWADFASQEPAPRPKARDIIAKRFQEGGLYNSLTESMSGPLVGDARPLTRREDGDWDLGLITKTPEGFIDQSVNAIHQLVGTKLGLDNDNLLVRGRELMTYGFLEGHDPKAAQNAMHQAQQDGNFSDEEMAAGFEDLRKSVTKFEDGEKARVLSDGTVMPNMQDSDWLDDEKAKAIIESLPISDEAKQRELADLARKQTLIAPQKMEAYARAAYGTPMESPDEWADRVGRQKDFGTKEFVRDYEAEVASKAGWGQGLAAGFHKGNLKLAMTLTGAAGMITEDEALANEAASYAYASSMLSEGSFDTGLIGSLQEELPSLLAIATITRGVGAGVGAAVTSRLGAAAATSVAEGAATTAMLGTSFMQSAGATFASSMQEGDTIKEAKEKATKAGMTTALVTGLFQFAGAGGLEKQLVTKSSGQVTVRDLFKTLPKEQVGAAAGKMLGQLLGAVGSEAAEEGIDEAIQSFVTADPDTNLADAWSNAIDAAKVGGFIGGAMHVAAGEIDAFAKARDLIPQTAAASVRAGAQSMQQASTKSATSEGLVTAAQKVVADLRAAKTAAEAPRALTVEEQAAGLTEADLKPAQPFSEQQAEELRFLEERVKEDGSFDPKDLDGWRGYTIDDATVPTPDAQLRKTTDLPSVLPTGEAEATSPFSVNPKKGIVINEDATGSQIAEALFGPAPEGSSYNDDVIDPSKFSIRKDGTVMYSGRPYNRRIEADGTITEDNTRVRGEFKERTIPGDWLTSEQQYQENEQDLQGGTEGEGGLQAQVQVREMPTGEAQATPPAGDVGGPATTPEAAPEVVESAAVAPTPVEVKAPVEAVEPIESSISSTKPTPQEDETKIETNVEGQGQAEGQVLTPAESEIASLEKQIQEKEELFKDVDPDTAVGARKAKEIADLKERLSATKASLQMPEAKPAAKPRSEVRVKEADSIATLEGDSVVGDDTPLGPLSVGQPIIVESQKGTDVVGVRVVMSKEIREDGKPIYKISSPMTRGTVKMAAQMGEGSMLIPQSDIDELAEVERTRANAVGSSDVAKAKQGINTIAKKSLARVAGKQYSEDLLDFDSSPSAPMARLERGGRKKSNKIVINPTKWFDRLERALAGIPEDSEIANMIRRDFIAEMQAAMWHEANHDIVDQELRQNEEAVMDAMRSLLENAKTNEPAREFLMTRVRARFDRVFPDLAEATDEQLLSFLQGETVMGRSLSGAELDEEVFAAGAEFLADFVQNLRSGMDPMSIRAASDRFVSSLVGDPSKIDEFTAKNLITRIVELLNRAMEAMSRFMNAHRMMGTLPPSFQQLAMDIDQVMQGKGIQAPDFANILTSSLNSLNARMQQVDTVEQILSSKRWKQDEDTKSEYDLKEQVRLIIRNIQAAHPKVMPVSINPVSGKLEARADIAEFIPEDQVEVLQSNLDKLNDPRRSLTALDAAEAAKDMRLILRNLNFGIPMGPSLRGQEPGYQNRWMSAPDLESALQVLNENLEVDFEARVGLPVEEVLRQVNARRDAISSTSEVSEPDYNAVHKTLENYSPYALKVKNKENLEAQLNALTAELEKTTEPSSAKAINVKINKLAEQIEYAKFEIEAVIESVRSFKPSMERSVIFENEEMIELRSALIKAEVAQRQARERVAMRDDFKSLAQLRTIADLARLSLDADQLAELAPGVNPQVLEAALNKIRDVRAAYARLSIIPDHLDYMLLGGRKPPLMRGPARDQEWQAIQKLKEGISQPLALLPVGAVRIVRGTFTGDTKEISGTDVPITIEDSEIGTIEIKTASDLDPDRAGRPDVNRLLATQINDAVKASSRLLGMEEGERGSIESEERRVALMRNARALGRMLSRDFHDAMIKGDPAANTLSTDQAGFPSEAFVDATGEPRGVMAPEAIALPEIPETTFDKVDPNDKDANKMRRALDEASFRNGFYAKTLLAMARFMNRIEGIDPNLHTKAVLWHGGGMTPAGAAYSIVAPRFLDFVALTKASNDPNSKKPAESYYDMMRASLTDPADIALFDSIYNGLTPGLENNDNYNGSNELMSNVHSKFWILREGAKAASEIYKASIEESSEIANRRSDPEKEVLTDETRSPLDESLLRGAQFNNSLNAAMSKRLLGDSGILGDRAISLMRPVAASESLEVLDSLDEERQRIVKVSNLIKNGQITSWDDAVLKLQSDDKRDDTDLTPMSDAMDNKTKEWLLEQMAQEEARYASREERVITQLLLSLYGGNETAVRRTVNAFADVRGEDVYWDRHGLREFLRRELERMRNDELARGSIVSDVIYDNEAAGRGKIRNVVYDEVFKGNETRKGLIEKFPEHRAMLEQILLTGGHIHSFTEVGAFSMDSLGIDPEKVQKFDSSAASVLQGILGKIGNVTILTGRVKRTQMYGDEETRVPSLAFIPDKTNPVLVLPYGHIAPTTEEANAAIEAAIGWMAEHGGVDVAELAKPIIDQILSVLPERAYATLRAGTVKMAESSLHDFGITVVPDEELKEVEDGGPLAADIIAEYNLGGLKPRFIPQSRFEQLVEGWTASAVSRVEKALAEMNASGADAGDPALIRHLNNRTSKRLRGNRQSSKLAVKVLTQALTNNAVKELLVLTSFEQKAQEPTDIESALLGELAGYHNVRGMAELAIRNNNAYLEERGMDIEDRLGRGIRRAEKDAKIDPAIESFWKPAYELFVDETKDQEPPSVLNPLAPKQAAWANATLHGVVRGLTPTTDSSKPMVGAPRVNSGLSEYEARQLLSVFGHEALREALDGRSLAADDSWGSPQFIKVKNEGGLEATRAVTVDDIMNATGEAAKRIQDIFKSGWAVTGSYPRSTVPESASMEMVRRYGTYGILDPLTEGRLRNKWADNRMAKGAIWAAEMMGVEFENVGGVRKAIIAPDLEALKKRAAEQYLLKKKETIYDEAGRPLPDGKPIVVDVFDAMKREVLAENFKNEQFIKQARNEAKREIKRRERLEKAIKALDEALKVNEFESIEAMLKRIKDTGDAGLARLATRAVRQFMKDREQAANDLARDLVSNFETSSGFVEAFQDPLSPRQSAVVSSASPAMERLRRLVKANRAWHYSARAIAKRVADGESAVDTFEARREYNKAVQSILRDETVASVLTGEYTARALMIQPGDTARMIERRAGAFAGLMNRLNSVETVRDMAMRSVLREAARANFRVGSEVRSVMADRMLADARLDLPANAQVKILNILTENKDLTDNRESVIQQIGRVIYDETFKVDQEVTKGAESSARYILGRFLSEAKDGKINHAVDVFKVLTAAAQSAQTDPEVMGDPFVRNQAIVQMLRNSVSEYARGSADMIRGHLLQIAHSKIQRSRFSAFRLEGSASLTLATEVKPGGKAKTTASSLDVEVFRRVLNEYGKMWSRIYMDHYGKSDFVVGLSAAEQAAADADKFANMGAGKMVRFRGQTYRRVSEGILEPLDARERVRAIIRARGAKVRPELVMARLRRSGGPKEPIGPGGLPIESSPAPNPLGMGKDEFSNLIAQIRSGETKPIAAGTRVDAYEQSLKEARSRAVQEIRDRILSTKQRIENIQRYKHLRGLRDRAKRELAVLEAELEVVNERPGTPLFMPDATDKHMETAAKVADRILANFNPLSMKGVQGIYIERARIAGGLDDTLNPDLITRSILKNQIMQSMNLLHGGILVGVKGDPKFKDLDQELKFALDELKKDPNNPSVHARFHAAQVKGLNYEIAMRASSSLAAGYVHTKNPVETGWFYRAFLHEGAKVKGIFAKSLDAQKKANMIRSILYRGTDGTGGKDAYRLIYERKAKLLADAANEIPKERRFVATARGMLLGQLRSYMNAYDDTAHSAKSVLKILNTAEAGYARANAKSRGDDSNAFDSIRNFVPKKLTQLWNRLHERGFHQLDNQLVLSDMLNEVIPMLESHIKAGGGDKALSYVISNLEKSWGKEATKYESALTSIYADAARGLANVLAMRGEKENVLTRPVVPFVWSDMSNERYTSSDVKSVGDLLDPNKATWKSSPFRVWKTADKFDLLDFDGISAPLRVLDDMIYRTMVAPAYDSVAAIVGDVSTASEHFTQFITDPTTGKPKSGAISAIEEQQHDDGLTTEHEWKKAEAASLAIGNMLKDEIMNDMLGFSASSRAIKLYRKIAIIGLGRKLISLVQPIIQPLSPVIGYVATNTAFRNTKGLSFVPVLLKYGLGKLPFEFGGAQAKGFAEAVDSIVLGKAPVIAFRAADGVDMAREAAEDAQLRSNELAPSPFLGAAAPVLAPVARAGGAVVEGYFKFTTKALATLIGKPEGVVIRPMLAHEMLVAVNEKRAEQSMPPITMETMLSDPDKSGITAEIIQDAVVKVEELFGTSAREQRGKAFQPSKSLIGEVAKSALTTLSGHPTAMAANSWGAWRMLTHNAVGSKEWMEGLRILSMTVSQNMAFVFLTGPVVTYMVSSALAAINDWDEEKRREWEGWWYGIDPGDEPGDRQKKLRYWVSTLINRNEDPYGYSWHKGEWSEEQEAKHDGYRWARFTQEIINQLPVVGSLTSTTLGGSVVDMGLKASGISPASAVKQAGIVLPEKWGFSGTANDPDNEDTPAAERALYQATSFWANYLSDANSMAFAMDAMFQGLKYASNNPDDLTAWDAFMIAMHMAPGVREKDRAIQRYVGTTKSEFIALKEWGD